MIHCESGNDRLVAKDGDDKLWGDYEGDQDDYLGSVTLKLKREGEAIKVDSVGRKGPKARQLAAEDAYKLDWDESTSPFPGLHLFLEGSGAKFEVWMCAVTPVPAQDRE